MLEEVFFVFTLAVFTMLAAWCLLMGYMIGKGGYQMLAHWVSKRAFRMMRVVWRSTNDL